MTQLLIFQPLYNILAALCIFLKGNLGGAVLIMAALIRIAIWPWYRGAMNSQRKLAKLQPKIKTLQKKFKADPTQANKEVMKLFQEEKLNPFGSFFFIFVQMAIFITLYIFFTQALKTDWSIYLYPVISKIPALNYTFLGINLRTPSFILALISALLNSVMTFVQPKVSQNRFMILALPFIILLFYKRFPAIILLYWVGITLVSIVQEILMARVAKSSSEK